MARTLVWYILREKLSGSPDFTYRLDADYEPNFAWAIAKIAPGAQPVRIDIVADSTTIFQDTDSVIQIAAGETVVKADGVKQNKIREGQIVNLNILQTDGSVGDITVGLELL